MNNPLLVRRLECLGDLSRDRQRLVQRNRTLGDAIGQRGTFDKLQDERVYIA